MSLSFTEHILPALQGLGRQIPPSVSQQAAAYVITANSQLHSLRDTYVPPYITSSVNSLLSSPPDLFSILLLFLLFIISLKVLDYARRVITFWVVLVFRLVFWGSLFGAAWYVYSVGWERAAGEAAWVLGLLEGFVQHLLASAANQDSRGNSSSYKAKQQSRWS
jgi:hypothetical protein